MEIFNKFWPDCSFDKYILTNHQNYNRNGFVNLSIGDDVDWSSNLKKGLSFLNTLGYDHVFTMVEDYYFINKIDNQFINNLFNSFVSINASFLRLYNVINPRISFMVNPFFGKVQNYIPYRQTIAFTFWRLDVLNDLLLEGESAWEFEKIGVRRGFLDENFYALKNNIFEASNLVVKGKIVPIELKRLRKIIPINNIKRKMLSSHQFYISLLLSKIKLSLLNYLPSRISSILYFDFANRKK